jgi:hypothetical protein
MATTKASNKAKVIKLIISALLITSINSTSAYAAGRATPLPTNTVLSGNGVPSTSIGIDGDFYIDIKSLNMYGPKVKNKWPLPISLKGPAGPIGPSGVDGKSGTSGSTSSTVGATGPAGPVGPAGPAGPAGATGAQGPAGSGSGSPGPQGAAGATGATGPKGDTGTAGATGPSNAYFGTIPFVGTLAAAAGNSKNSSSFGNFINGKKYIVDVMIYGVNGDPSTYALSLSASASAGTPTISVKYLAMEGHTYRPNSDSAEHSVIAKIIVDASTAGSDFSLIASVKCGTSTSGSPMTFSGDYVALLVGAIN